MFGTSSAIIYTKLSWSQKSKDCEIPFNLFSRAEKYCMGDIADYTLIPWLLALPSRHMI